jgi:hypothetical protein
MKSDVYSWRLSPARKAALEQAARAERTTIAEILERATDEWMRSRQPADDADEREQARLRSTAARFVGSIRGGDPDRSRRARIRVRSILAQRRGR